MTTSTEGCTLTLWWLQVVPTSVAAVCVALVLFLLSPGCAAFPFTLRIERSKVKTLKDSEKPQDFLSKKFEEKKLKEVVSSATKALVLGMGGGCDVFSAYALAKFVAGDPSEVDEACPTGSILYGNCISERGELPGHPVLVKGALYAVPAGPARPLVRGEETYGTTLLEQSAPRGAGGSPLLFELKGCRGLREGDAAGAAAMTRENRRRVHAALDHLGVDFVLAADTGGDSLTGGKDWAVSKVTGRDQQVLSALVEYRKVRPHFRFIHVVLGPGCDAETSEDEMRRQVAADEVDADLPWCAGRRYLGAFSMEAAIAEMVPLVATLAPNRTPGIMWRALADTENCHLPRAPVAEGENGGHDDGEDRVVLERHGNQALVPRRWLYHGLVFDYAEPELFL